LKHFFQYITFTSVGTLIDKIILLINNASRIYGVLNKQHEPLSNMLMIKCKFNSYDAEGKKGKMAFSTKAVEDQIQS